MLQSYLMKNKEYQVKIQTMEQLEIQKDYRLNQRMQALQYSLNSKENENANLIVENQKNVAKIDSLQS